MIVIQLPPGSSTGGGGGWPAWAAPVLSAAGVILVAVLTAWFTASRERTARRSGAARTALYELQEAAHRLRLAYSAYGEEAKTRGPNGVSPATTKEMDDAEGKLDLMNPRCDKSVQASAESWRDISWRYRLGDPTVPYHDEVAAWQALQASVRVQLDALD